MKFADAYSELRLERVDIVDTPSGREVKISAIVRTNGFQGENEELWFEQNDVREFLSNLEIGVVGNPKLTPLTSLSNEEFGITFLSIGSSSQLIAKGFLATSRLVYMDWVTCKLEFEIELDPSSITKIKRELEELFF